MKGKHRRRQARDFYQEGNAGHPPKVDTVFSVEKRRMSLVVLARVSSYQHKTLVFRAISYNSWRVESLLMFLVEDFYIVLNGV